MTALVTDDGQVTLPREICERLGLCAGETLEMQTEGNLLLAWKQLDGDLTEKLRGRGTLPVGSPVAADQSEPHGDRLRAAIDRFVKEEATLGQAAQAAGMWQADFLRELGRRRIPIHYGMEELAEDLKAVEALAGR